MTSAEKSKKRFSTIQLAAVVIALLSLVVAFTGVKVQDITSFISASLSPQVDYSIKSLTTPSYISSGYGQSLSVSAEYIVITNVGLSSDDNYQGSPMRFSVSFENRGKNVVEQPRVLILIVDPLYRIWGIWNKSATSDEITRGWSFDYIFPPLDQKVIGTWVIISHLYDDATPLPLLVSYEFRMFRVTDEASSSSEEIILLAVVVLMATAAGGMVANVILDELRDRKKPESTAKSKRKGVLSFLKETSIAIKMAESMLNA